MVRSDLSVPEAIAKGLAIYLMMAIGLKGGVEVAEQGPSTEFLIAALLGIGLSFLVPIPVFWALRTFGRLNAINAGAVAAHCGSVMVELADLNVFAILGLRALCFALSAMVDRFVLAQGTLGLTLGFMVHLTMAPAVAAFLPIESR